MALTELEARLRYQFRNAELLRQAMTHRSHSATHNERLEFLGDSVLNCVVAALLYERFSKLDEGDLSRVRANLVKQQSLYEIASALNIAEFLNLGEGELRSGGFRRPSILADTLEAIFGAVYVDAGFEEAQKVVRRLYEPILDHIDPQTLGKDAKTLLQEYLQGHKIALPLYSVVATLGAAHNQQFEVECAVPKLDIKVFGNGASRRAAEQAAAKKALEEVQTVAPALLGKPKRPKGGRGAKKDVIQGALDLRTTPERKPERAKPPRTEEGKSAEAIAAIPAVPPVAAVPMMRATHVERTGGDGAADKGGVADKAAGADKSVAPEKGAVADKSAGTDNGAATDKGVVADRNTAADKATAVKPARVAEPAAAAAPDPEALAAEGVAKKSAKDPRAADASADSVDASA
jgi:ribonuclease-3